MKTITRQQARDLDARAMEQYGVAGIVLMENAGRGVAEKLVQLEARSPVVICCGKGNNAGDGFVIARHLQLRDIEPRVMLCGNPEDLRGDAAVNFQIIERSRIEITRIDDAVDRRQLAQLISGGSWLVDALLGTGARGEPRPPMDAVIDAMNGDAARILAVDLPSGLDCDTGVAATHTIRAAHTCTFVAAKRGFESPQSENFTGEVHVIDIGAPKCLVDQILAAQ